MLNNKIIKELQFGKCLMSQKSKIEPLIDEFKVPFEHAFDCPLEQIFYNISESKRKEIEDNFTYQTLNNNKRVKFASVGLVVDKDV
jgi:hypothetical protein